MMVPFYQCFRIVMAVSKCYEKYFKKYPSKRVTHQVIAALVLQEDIDENATFETVILTAGTKWNTDICAFKLSEQPPYEENYCWDMCEGHAESVCLRLAFLYFLNEMHCAHENSLSIFTYNEGTGYHLKETFSFHMFISHRPCGFMSDKLVQPLFWKDFAGKSPHVLKCSSKLLISSYLGIQGPLSCVLSKPIYLSSIVILRNEDSKKENKPTDREKENTPTDRDIESHYEELKSKLMSCKERVRKTQSVGKFLIFLQQKKDETGQYIDFAEMIKYLGEMKDSFLNFPGIQEINPEELPDVVIPKIAFVPTSSLTNRTLFNQNPLLIDDTRKYHTDSSFIALPGIIMSSPCNCSTCGNSNCACCTCGCCTQTCFSCGCPICGCCFKVNVDTKCSIWENVGKFFLPLQHKPKNAADKLNFFCNAIIVVLESILSIKESIEEMEMVMQSRFINELKAVIEMLSKFIAPTEIKQLYDIKFCEILCETNAMENIYIKTKYFKWLEGKCDKGDAKKQVNECLQTLAMHFFLRRLRTTNHITLGGIDCDWQRNIEQMKYWFE